MAPRRRCPTCGSRQWHKEPLSGLVACSEGHVLQNYRSENNEVNQSEIGHAMSKRKLKSTLKRREPKSRANTQLYHGARGRYHYFACQQHLLRTQIETITQLWNLPPEFEVICRDIWSLHLSLLQDPPPPEPLSFLQEQDNNDKNQSQNTSTRQTSGASTLQPISEQTPGLPIADGEDQEDVEEGEKSDPEDDSEMEELLRQNSEISSSSDEGDPEDPARTSQRVKTDGRGRTKMMRATEGPASTLAIMMIALWQLRIPVMYNDFARIIESYELPYLDPVRLLPSSMVVHLTKHSIQALSPYHVPSTLSMHKLTARLAKRINSVYDVFTPECNTAIILWRLTRDMGGTPTLYALAKRLAHILKLPLTLHPSLAPGLRIVKLAGPEHHKYDNIPPEVALMAVMIMVLKMSYGLDGKPRYPESVGDLVLALPRADKWLAQLKEQSGLDAVTNDALFSSENVLAVGDLSENLLDDYLSFCEHALLDPENRSDDIIATKHFPITRGTLDSDTVKVKSSRPAAPAGVLANGFETKPLRPGEEYAIWSSRDVFGTLPEEYGAVLAGAVKRIRTGEEYLCGVIELYERRFVRWWEEEKRREKAENGGEEAQG